MKPLQSFSETTQTQVLADATFNAGKLTFQYCFKKMLLPRFSTDSRTFFLPPSERKQQLWEKTCFEGFFCQKGKESYWELNFSLDGYWNAYSFSSYRNGFIEEKRLETPCLKWSAFQDENECEWITVSWTIDLAPLCIVPPFSLGLSCILELDSSLKYWALLHPNRDKADFHDQRGWTLEIAL